MSDSNSIGDKLREMQKKFDYKKNQEQLKKLATVRKKMIDAIHTTFEFRH